MTLVWGARDHQPGTGARTHVLVVGVGRYPHLIGGSTPKPGLPPLGQLTSPPASARALAQWFITGQLAGAPAPLGSVELLLSDSNGQSFGNNVVEDATSQNIQDAFDDWKRRCDGDPDNVAVFYFCGHGLQKDVVALLPEDFGQSVNNPWRHAIDFDGTYAGMARCSAGTQLYIVDACREVSGIAIIDEAFGGTPLIGRRVGQNKLRTAPKLFATAEGRRAFGDSNQPSRLTAALIACLDGLGATEENNQWAIDTLHLGPAVQRLIKYEDEINNTPESSRQIVDPAGGDLARGPQRLLVLPNGSSPNVIVNLCCNPDSITPHVTFYAEPVPGQRRNANAPGRWKTTLPAGSYVLGCSFTLQNAVAAPPTDVSAPRAFVKPPIWDHPINVPLPHPP